MMAFSRDGMDKAQHSFALTLKLNVLTNDFEDVTHSRPPALFRGFLNLRHKDPLPVQCVLVYQSGTEPHAQVPQFR